jgi:uncharacterized repeat protein (TIGR03847 family)
MPPLVVELNPVSRITTNAVGPPGSRTFYLQGRKGGELISLIVEKQQVLSLAVAVEQFLAELQKSHQDLPEASSEFHEADMGLDEPIDPLFRVGQLGLGYDESRDLVVVEAREIQEEGANPEEASIARLWCTRSQLRALCHWGLEIAGRGRPICGNCGEPMDPGGHFCPKRNGHKR